MEELGPPVAYIALEEGTPVYDRSGERIGVVDHVLGDEAADVFEGVIVHKVAPGGHMFADVGQIAELRERGVLLSVDRDALHDPSERPASMKAQPDDTVESPLRARLRRAWDWISGRR
jgi:hypothetical protein